MCTRILHRAIIFVIAAVALPHGLALPACASALPPGHGRVEARAGAAVAQNRQGNQGPYYRKAPAALLRLKKVRLLGLVGGTLLSFGLMPGVWVFSDDTNRLVVNEVTIRLPDWPAPFDRLRIAAVSDLHVGSRHVNLDRLQRVVDATNGARPDLVVLLGDFVSQGASGAIPVEPEAIAGKLKGLRAPLGVVAVLGNHDWWYDGPRVRQALEQVGIRVLENDVAQIRRDGHSVWLAGLADFWTRQPDVEGTLRQVPGGEPVIALTHNPDLFPRIPPRVGLTLAGHTHGSQIKLPLVGPLVVPSNYGRRYAAGHVQEGGRHLFITPGIGTSFIPARFRVVPEVSVLTIVHTRGDHKS